MEPLHLAFNNASFGSERISDAVGWGGCTHLCAGRDEPKSTAGKTTVGLKMQSLHKNNTVEVEIICLSPSCGACNHWYLEDNPAADLLGQMQEGLIEWGPEHYQVEIRVIILFLLCCSAPVSLLDALAWFSWSTPRKRCRF
jgi:hypothetical protein